MKRVSLRPQRLSQHGASCHFCRFSTFSVLHRLPFIHYSPGTAISSNVNLGQLRSKQPLRAFARSPLYTVGRFAPDTSKFAGRLDPATAVKQLEQDLTSLKESASAPSERSIVQLLQKCQDIAATLTRQDQPQPIGDTQTSEKDDNAISPLLDLAEVDTKSRALSVRGTESPLADSLSRIANDLLRDERVFISPKALACYTEIQSLLKRGDGFPEIFYLYAHKKIPEANSTPVRYIKQNPKSVKNAVPAELANMALDIAIEQRDLLLVLDIIDNTFAAPAFRRAKVFKKASIPLGSLAALPVACYGIASWLATLQHTMDPGMATGIAFVAVLTYAGVSSSFGLLALTTYNDQMERVVWLTGTPLRLRWLREEERAALDKVALAWGFKDVNVRGEEEGEDWENLREAIGMRGMLLDKTDLMPGME